MSPNDTSPISGVGWNIKKNHGIPIEGWLDNSEFKKIYVNGQQYKDKTLTEILKSEINK